MEEILKAVIIGVVQGLTEFLPISSTAHIRIIPSFFGWKDIGASYTAVIQVGTMIAIIIYFWKDLMNMFKSFFISIKQKNYDSKDTRLFLQIIFGTIPIVLFGFLFKTIIRNQFRSMYVMAGSLIFFSFMILIAEKYTKKKVTMEMLGYKDALFIGFFQAIALIPGASRSGSTISGGFFRNMKKEDSARFSFLLSIPAVLLSGCFELFSQRAVLLSGESAISSLIIATIVSGIIGYWSIGFLLSFIKTKSLMMFIVYRILFGVLIIVLLSLNIISN